MNDYTRGVRPQDVLEQECRMCHLPCINKELTIPAHISQLPTSISPQPSCFQGIRCLLFSTTSFLPTNQVLLPHHHAPYNSYQCSPTFRCKITSWPTIPPNLFFPLLSNSDPSKINTVKPWLSSTLHTRTEL